LSPRLPLRVTTRAAQEIAEASAWWDANRPAAPEAFREAIERAFELISTQPGLGAAARSRKLAGIRRLHLSRIRYHLYYRVTGAFVEVVALWHTSRYPDPGI